MCVGGWGWGGGLGIKTYICSKDEEFWCDIMTGDASSVAVFVREQFTFSFICVLGGYRLTSVPKMRNSGVIS